MAPAPGRRARLGAGTRCGHAHGKSGIHPRNHVVEAALDAAMGRQDFQPFEELLTSCPAHTRQA